MRTHYATMLLAALSPIACADKPTQSQNGPNDSPVVQHRESPTKPTTAPSNPAKDSTKVAGAGQGQQAGPALGGMPEGLDLSPLPNKPFAAPVLYKALPADTVKAFAAAGGKFGESSEPLVGFARASLSNVGVPAGLLPGFFFDGGSERTLANLPVCSEKFGLALYEMNLTPALVAQLAKQPNLFALDFRGRFNAASIKELAKLKGLRSLTLWPGKQNRPADLEAIAALTSLNHLAVYDSPLVRGPVLKQWAAMPQLEFLDLRGSSRLVDDDLASLEGMGQLRALGLGFCDKLHGADLRPVSKLRRLESLEIDSSETVADVLKWLAPLGRMRHLSVMPGPDFSPAPASVKSATATLKSMPHLESLVLHLVSFDDRSLEYLLTCKN